MRITNKVLSTLTLVLTGTAISSGAVQAAGFYLQEQSVRAQGSAFSGSVSNLQDPSTIYFNPAGMTRVKGTQGNIGVHILAPSADLTDTGSTEITTAPITGGDGGNPYSATPLPNAYISHQMNEQMWFGLGISAPFGLANEYDDDWFGRYDSIETELQTIDIQPTLAYKVSDKLSIGAGLNFQYADAKLTNAINDGVQGLSTLEGDDWSLGYTLGAQYKPFEETTIGLSYRSAISHELDGDVKVEGTLGSDFDVPGTADLNLPDIATLGISQQINDKLTLQGQATWFGWNNFQDIETIVGGTSISNVVQNYQTTWAFALGAEYDLNDKWDLRGGVQFDETPTTDEYRTSRTPDGDRTWLSGGATYAFSDKIDLDMAATYIWIEDQELNLSRNNGLATVQADTEGSVAILSLGLTYKF